MNTIFIEVIIRIKDLVTIFLLTSLTYQINGQIAKPNFRNLTTSQGLSNNTVFDIIQDDIGFLWVATKSGLNRFDGYGFESFAMPNASGENTENNTVFALLKDHDNLVWIGQKDSGLVSYNRSENEFIRFAAENKSDFDWNTITVKALFEDSRHWLWIGTFGNGVIVLDEERKVVKRFCNCNVVGENERLIQDYVFDFAEDKKGNIYIASSGKGLNMYNGQTESIQHIHASDNRDMDSFSKTVLFDTDKILWVGTEGNGLYALNTETNQWSIYRRANSNLSSNIITDVQINAVGQLWIATDGGGLNTFNFKTQSFQHHKYDYRQSNSLNTDALYNLYFDTSNNLWIGTFNGGVNILNAIQPPFITNRNHYEEKKLDLRSVLAIQEDNENRVWLGTDGGGIFYFNNSSDSIMLHSANDLVTQGQIDDVVTCFQTIPNKGFWYGTFARGLSFFDSRTGRVIKYVEDDEDVNSLSNNNVWDLALDKNGGLWIGTLGNGVDYLPPGQTSFVHYGNFSGKLSGVQIVDLQMQQDNKYLWIATESNGLNRLDLSTKEIKQFQYVSDDPSGLSSNNIYSLNEDNEGRLWIVTDAGVNLYDSGSGVFKDLNLSDNNLNGAINNLQCDKDGFLWFASSTDIFRYNPLVSELIDFGKDPSIQNTTYNPKASLLTMNGRIIMGGVNGFSIVTPDRVKLNDRKVAPVISDIKIGGKSIRTGKYNERIVHQQNLNDDDLQIDLSYKYRDISFTIGTTDLTNPLQNKYAYKLDGYDEDWTYVNASQQTINYTSLEGGEYSLLMKAASSSGIWNEEIKEVSIIVQPPFWKTAWFIIFAILALAGTVLLIYRFLLNRQKEIFELKALEQEQAIMKQDQEILQLNNQNLEQEVSNKKAELNASILEMAHKNEFLTVLKSKIKKIQANSDSSAKRPLQSIVNIIDSEQRQEDYWDKFQHIFNETFQDFIDQVAIKHPNLTQNENRLSCFIRMNLTNKEIASILNITLNGVEQAKYRLKKKMELSKDQNLNSYIQQFGKEQSS